MQSIPSLPSNFLVNNASYKEVASKDLQVGSYYFMHEIVVEFYSLYDYLLQVVSKSDNEIQVKKIYTRYHDNSYYPGNWETSEETLETISIEDTTIFYYME